MTIQTPLLRPAAARPGRSMAGDDASTATLDEERWAAVHGRVAEPVCGPFRYAVTSQGIYCRPGCPARTPLRRNTRFFADGAAAAAAGFRPCRRCDPDDTRAQLQAEVIRAACAQIEAAETIPSLATLAARSGYAKHHFLRLFRDITGVTPRSYAETVRARRLQAALAGGERVAAAVAEAGFGSESRVYGAPGHLLGMRPGAARRGGAGERIRTAAVETTLGPALLGMTEAGLCFLGFGDSPEELEGDLRHRFPRASVEPAPEALAEAARAVVGLIEEPRGVLALPLDLRGTAFQARVWQALREIPAGETRSYAGLASAIGAPRAVRAVARACAQNPVSVAVPCHRVVGRDGALTGYRWGLARKRTLLARERGEA